MTTVGNIASTLRRGVICGWWLKCPECGGRDVAWEQNAYEAYVLACRGCDAEWADTKGLVRGDRCDGAGRM